MVDIKLAVYKLSLLSHIIESTLTQINPQGIATGSSLIALNNLILY